IVSVVVILSILIVVIGIVGIVGIGIGMVINIGVIVIGIVINWKYRSQPLPEFFVSFHQTFGCPAQLFSDLFKWLSLHIQPLENLSLFLSQSQLRQRSL